ncbi:MAG: hypothetical protein JST00_00725 [Deltaproteobacteria bacterium]|nr:hypothetical protein [Deltaproteobacteria bacterium]
MSATLIVAGRRGLPCDATRAGGGWCVELTLPTDEDLGVEIEARASWGPRITEIVGFAPEIVVAISPAWIATEAVARELARAVEGVVFSEVDGLVAFDAREEARPCATVAELEARLEETFEREAAAWAEAEAAASARERARFASAMEQDPEGIAADNDWSDLSPYLPRTLVPSGAKGGSRILRRRR